MADEDKSRQEKKTGYGERMKKKLEEQRKRDEENPLRKRSHKIKMYKAFKRMDG